MEQIVNSGWLEVIAGCMFGGKSEELIKRMKRVQYAGKKYQIFHPQVDKRYSEDHVVSHDKTQLKSTSVDEKNPLVILDLVEEDTEVVGVDEVQFFGDEIIEVVNKLADRGKRVIVAGLDTDFLAQPFGPAPALMATADFVTKVHAICVKCGNPASKSMRTVQSDEKVLIGAEDAYIPVCRRCFKQADATPQGGK